MIEKLERYTREEDGVKISCPPDNAHIIYKINELVDAFNIFDPEEIGNQFHALSVAIKRLTERIEKLETPAENVRPPYMQNKRLRKALGIAQSALVKLANDAYDIDENIYIDKILNQIERITKGGDNE